MDKQSRAKFLVLYTVIGLTVVLAGYFELENTYFLSRPLIIASLLFFVGAVTSQYRNDFRRKVLMGGLFLNLTGDFMLIFRNESEAYLITSMVLFLSAVLLYTLFYTRNILDNRPWSQHWSQFALAALILLYGVEFYVMNYKDFGMFKYPALVFCISITMLSISAALRNIKNDRTGYYMVLIGTVLIVTAYTILSVSYFSKRIPMTDTIFVGLYVVAMYLMVMGSLRIFTRVNPQIA